MRLRKRKKWLTNLYNYLNKFQLIRNSNFKNWGFLRYLYNVSIRNRYDIEIINSNSIQYGIMNLVTNQIALLIIRKDFLRRIINIEFISISNEYSNTAVLIQKLKNLFSKYKLLDYKLVIVNISTKDNELIRLFSYHLSFVEDEKNNLNRLVKGISKKEKTFLKNLRE